MFDQHHRRMRHRVEAHVDGQLALDASSEVEAHLADCPDCRCDAEILGRIKGSLRRIAEREPTALAAARLRRWITQRTP